MVIKVNKSTIIALVATKNRPDLLLERAIRSISQQHRVPDLVVLIDDSDKEHYFEKNKFAIQFLEKNSIPVKYLLNNRTKGASGAWNTGIDWIANNYKNADSTFLAILDDDDEWLPEYIESNLNILKSSKIDWIACAFNRIENISSSLIQTPPDNVESGMFLVGNPGIQGSNFFIRLNILLMAGCFDEALESCTDRDLCIRICDLRIANYVHNPKVLMNHYAESDRDRLSNSTSPSKYNGLNSFWLKYYSRMQSIQRNNFCLRAKKLFNWKPEDTPPIYKINKQYQKKASCSIQERIEKAYTKLQSIYVDSELSLLGYGNEGVVYTDKQIVIKYFDFGNLSCSNQLEYLKSMIGKWENHKGLYNLSSLIIENDFAILTYKFEQSKPYTGGLEKSMIDFLISCSYAGIVCNNLKPENFIITDKELKFIDYGKDIKPWSELGFEHMVRRAFVCVKYAKSNSLKIKLREAISSKEFEFSQEYKKFRSVLIGFDRNIYSESIKSVNLFNIEHCAEIFNLHVGVITSDVYKFKRLLHSFTILDNAQYLKKIIIHVLCNDIQKNEIEDVIKDIVSKKIKLNIIDSEQQISDIKNGFFGKYIIEKPSGKFTIATARSLIQKYVGISAEDDKKSISWIIDDDMRIDTRALEYLAFLPKFKKMNVDILLGCYEGSSPNPPLNGLRVLLIDLYHNVLWLKNLPLESVLPDRSKENSILRDTYPDYYYDLSRKHSAHLEYPHWLEPEYPGETVKEAFARLLYFAPLIVTGYPFTRPVTPHKLSENYLDNTFPSVNRGGTTFVFNNKCLIETPNLMVSLEGHEARRSDMIWSIINKHYRGMDIRAINFPVIHDGRVAKQKTMNTEKVIDEIIGSAVYAGLCKFIEINPHHKLNFSASDINILWEYTSDFRNTRLEKLYLSVYRIKGLTKALSSAIENDELCALIDFLNISFTIDNYKKICDGAMKLNFDVFQKFLSTMIKNTEAFAHNKS